MRKGVVLVVVIGVMLVVFTLALAGLFTMTTESRVAEHKIKRTRAYYAIQAGTILAREMLRRDPAAGGWTFGNTYCINGQVGATPCVVTVNDAAIPYNVRITISALSGGGNPIAETAQIDVFVDY